MNEEINWITFHGQYDFSYLLKVILGMNLPPDFMQFENQLRINFPKCFDIKQIISENEDIKHFSLQKLGNEFGIVREGEQHQAGSDALLTIGKSYQICFIILKMIFRIRQFLRILLMRFLELGLSIIPMESIIFKLGL
jgi:CCR4-NOT transcription complex subunit 7/8